jgi:hypothetical protein
MYWVRILRRGKIVFFTGKSYFYRCRVEGWKSYFASKDSNTDVLKPSFWKSSVQYAIKKKCSFSIETCPNTKRFPNRIQYHASAPEIMCWQHIIKSRSLMRVSASIFFLCRKRCRKRYKLYCLFWPMHSPTCSVCRCITAKVDALYKFSIYYVLNGWQNYWLIFV